MKPAFPTLLGGALVLSGIAALQFGLPVLVSCLAFVLGFLLGSLSVIQPLVKHPHLHLYWHNGKLVRESMLIPQKGLRDMNGNNVLPGDILMMLDSGFLLKISRNPNISLNNPVQEASISPEA